MKTQELSERMCPQLANLCREEILLDTCIALLQKADMHLTDIHKGAVVASEGRTLYATKLRLAKKKLDELLSMCEPDEIVETYINRVYY